VIGEITNEIVSQCDGIVDAENLQAFQQIISSVLGKYNISEKNYEIVPWSEQVQKGYQMFFVAKKVEGLSDKSLQYYKYGIDRFHDFIKKPFDQVETDDIRYYLAYRQTTDRCSETTADNERRVLNTFFSWMNSEGYCPKNPVYPIKAIKKRKKVHHAFTDVELEKLRDGCKKLDSRLSQTRALAILETLLSTGCRVGELIGMKIDDLSVNHRSMVVFGKGKKERRVYFNEKAFMRICEYLEERGEDDSEYLFVTNDKHRNQLQVGGVESFIRELGEKTGVRKAHPHKFRRTAATTALKRGMPITDIQRMLGHASIETTKIYLDLDDSDLEYQHRKYL